MGVGRYVAAWILAVGLGSATLTGWVAIPHAPALDPLVLIVLWFNIALMIAALGLEIARRPYSLHLMHLICMYLFLGVASVLQYSRGILGVPGPVRLVAPQILPAAASTTLWLTGYLIAYEGRLLAASAPSAGFLNRPLTMARVFLLTGLSVLALAFLAAIGLVGAGTRGAAEVAIAGFAAEGRTLASPLYILINNLARALPPVGLMAALLVLLRDRGSWRRALLPGVLIVGVGTIVINNPFAASRMFFVTVMIAFAALFFLRRLQTGSVTIISIVISLAFLPALGFHSTRYAVDLRELRSGFEIMSPLEYLATNSDVDSLGMTALCQKWVDRFGIRWGLQLLGSLLSWIPRAYWPNKPVGTGTMVTEDLGFDFTNLSPPITAEALINFGLIGVPFCGALFGLALSRLDRVYWAPGRQGIGTTFRIVDALYPFWLGCIIYFTRGDFLPALVYTSSFTIWLVPLGLLSSRAWHPAQATSAAAAAPGAYAKGSARQTLF